VPNWLFELINPWTTPLALVVGVIAFAWACRIRGRWLAVVALSAAVGVALWQAWKSGPPNGLLDLQIYTNSARAWANGGSLYDYRDPTFNLSATYPPIGPLLFTSLTPLTADGREVLFTAINLLALFGCAWSVAGLARVDPTKRFEWSSWAFSAATVTIPVWLTLRQGQINIILWLLVLVDLDAMRRSSRWSGIGIGIATAIKLVPGLFILWLAASKRWRPMALAIGALSAATALGWALAPADSTTYWTDLLWESDRVGSVGDGRNNSVLGVIARILEPGSLRSGVWVLMLVAVLGVALVRSLRASRENDFLAVAAIVGCASAVASPISWTHHLGFLLVALVAFWIQATTNRAKILCLVAWLVLVDPGGHGDDPWMSTVRALMLIGAVCFTPIRKLGTVEPTANNQTVTTPSSRATNSTLPS
jgi:alpha-1,2-mannosyltransferase